MRERSFECFPYVCPEPVSVKMIVLYYENGQKVPFSRTDLGMIVMVPFSCSLFSKRRSRAQIVFTGCWPKLVLVKLINGSFYPEKQTSGRVLAGLVLQQHA